MSEIPTYPNECKPHGWIDGGACPLCERDALRKRLAERVSDDEIRDIFEEGFRLGLHEAAAIISKHNPPGDREPFEVSQHGAELRQHVLVRARDHGHRASDGLLANLRGRFINSDG